MERMAVYTFTLTYQNCKEDDPLKDASYKFVYCDPPGMMDKMDCHWVEKRPIEVLDGMIKALQHMKEKKLDFISGRK